MDREEEGLRKESRGRKSKKALKAVTSLAAAFDNTF